MAAKLKTAATLPLAPAEAAFIVRVDDAPRAIVHLPLPVHVQEDPAAPPGDLTSALADLLLARARRVVAAKAAASATTNGRRGEGA